MINVDQSTESLLVIKCILLHLQQDQQHHLHQQPQQQQQQQINARFTCRQAGILGLSFAGLSAASLRTCNGNSGSDSDSNRNSSSNSSNNSSFLNESATATATTTTTTCDHHLFVESNKTTTCYFKILLLVVKLRYAICGYVQASFFNTN